MYGLDPDEFYYFYKIFHLRLPFHFLEASRFSRNLHDFVRDLILIRIGEPVYVKGHVIDTSTYKLALGLMRAIGAGEYININDNEDIYYVKDINASIILTHLNLG